MYIRNKTRSVLTPRMVYRIFSYMAGTSAESFLPISASGTLVPTADEVLETDWSFTSGNGPYSPRSWPEVRIFRWRFPDSTAFT